MKIRVSSLRQNQILLLVSRILDVDKVPYTIHFLKETLLSNWSYPAVSCISQTLKLYGVENFLVRAPIQELIKENLFSFATLHDNRWVLVKSGDLEKILIEDVRTRSETNVPIGEFMVKWNGISLIYKISGNSSEPLYHLNKSRSNKLISARFVNGILATVIIASLITQFTQNPYYTSLILTKAIGLSISIILLAKGYNWNNSIVNRICAFRNYFNCGNQINILGRPSTLSQGGLVYFSSSLVITIISYFNPQFWVTSIFLSTGAVLCSIYLILYHTLRSEKWCPFCIVIYILVFFETALQVVWLSTRIQEFLFSWNHLLIFMAVISSSFFFTLLFKKLLINAINAARIKKRVNVVLNNLSVLNALFSRSDTLPDQLLTRTDQYFCQIKGAQHTLTSFLSPTCLPCKYQYHIIRNLFMSSKNFSVRIILVAKDKYDQRIIKGLLNDSRGFSFEVLDDWFLKGITSPVDSGEVFNGILDYEQSGLNSLPANFINEKMIPPDYSIEQTFYLLDN